MRKVMASHKDRLLFTKGKWSIYKADYVYAGNKGHVVIAYAHHNGCSDDGTYGTLNDPVNCWHTRDIKQKCILCDTDVPEGIQALIVLYQWEK